MLAGAQCLRLRQTELLGALVVLILNIDSRFRRLACFNVSLYLVDAAFEPVDLFLRQPLHLIVSFFDNEILEPHLKLRAVPFGMSKH